MPERTSSASDWRSLSSLTSDTAICTPAHHPARRTTSFVFLNTFIPQVNHSTVEVVWQLCPCSYEVRALFLFQGNYVKPGSLLEKQDQDLTALLLILCSPSGCIAQPLLLHSRQPVHVDIPTISLFHSPDLGSYTSWEKSHYLLLDWDYPGF